MPLRQDPITARVTPALMAAFARSVSVPRWDRYMRAAGHNEELAMKLYLWNAAVGQSFHFPLQTVEVALRNVANTALRNGFGANWWSDPQCRQVLGQPRCDDIDKSANRLRRKYGAPPHTDQVVASLNLGFWAALLHRQHHGLIWGGHVAGAFPNLFPPLTLLDVSAAADTVQGLRNRIFHHEPLIGHDLSLEYATITKLLGWICADTRAWMRSHSSVPVVMRMRPRQ